MSKPLKAYKVLRVGPGKGLGSVFAAPLVAVNYRKGRWVSARPFMYKLGYGLCVFNTIGDAQDFRDQHNSEFVIYEVECDGKKRRPAMLVDGFSDCEMDNHYARGVIFRLKHKLPINKFVAPSGTMMVRRVRLIKKVG